MTDADSAAQAPAPAAQSADELYLVDGSGFIFRAFHALPPLTRPDGTPVGAVLGFVNMLMKLLADQKAKRVAIVFDAARHNFRNEFYPEYKAHRPETPPELVPQFALIREATRAFDLPCLELDGYEADDVIATYARLAREQGAGVVVVSSDKDLMQLVGPGVRMLDPLKNKPIGPEEVAEKFGVAPEKVVDVQALCGDPVDNVPGVPGIGVKTAAQLIAEYGDLETLLARAGEIKQPKRRETLLAHADAARLSKRLVQLDAHAPVPDGLDALNVHAPDRERLLAFLREQGFRSVLARVERELPGTGEGAAAEAKASPPAVEARYELIQDEAALERWVAMAREAGQVAVDTETDSLTACSATLVGLSLAVAPGVACYVPLAHGKKRTAGELDLGGGEAPKQIAEGRALAILAPLLADPATLKIGHNFKFDLQLFNARGVAVTPCDDTLLLSYVLDGTAHGHGMDELAQLHLGRSTIAYKEVVGTGKNQITFDQVPLDKALAYAAEDADVTLQLWRILKPRLLAQRMVTLYETIERPLVQVVADMERAGVLVDRAALHAMSEEFGARLAQLEREVHGLAGESFNLGSPKQLGEVLFDKLGLPGGKKSKTGAWGTASDVLEPLADAHPIVRKLLDWRGLAKLKGTYTDALQEQIDAKTGRVHTSFSMAATATGRFSSSDPNLQNIPIRTEEGRKIRAAFVPAEGCVLLSADYSQIELRLAAELAGISALKQAFREGADIHAMTASQVFGVPMDQMTGEIRRRAKAINFGIIYGISGFGLAQQLSIPQAEAAAYIRDYLNRFHELRDYMERTKAFCREHGYVTTLYGRRCVIRGVADKNPAVRAAAERQAINAPLQGTAADIIKRAMVRIPGALRDAGLKGRMVLQVHDELVFEVPEAEADAAAALARKIMEGVADLETPLLVEARWGRNWDEAH